VGCSNGHCTAPLAAGRSFAAAVGLETVAGPEPCVPGEPGNACPELSDGVLDVNEKMGRYIQQHPDVDWMWIGHLSTTAYRVVKAVHQVAPRVKFVTGVFGADELTAEWCGPPCVGRLHAVMPFAVFGDRSAPGMNQLEQVMASRDRTDTTWRNVRYVQGYTTGLVWGRAVQRVVDRGEPITGPSIKAALESFVELSTDGLTAPISYSANDHRPNSRARIYVIDSSGQLSLRREVEVELEHWWLGW
jgi:branched-chain amino acid transport system substrate-binding protein